MTVLLNKTLVLFLTWTTSRGWRPSITGKFYILLLYNLNTKHTLA